jgi:lipoprotein-releasing system permease protein
MAPGFAWFVAWRHLRDQQGRRRRILWTGLALMALGAVALVADRLLRHHHGHGRLFVSLEGVIQNLALGGTVALVLGFLVALIGILVASFTVFTAISMFGVFLGTAAPILALSVMSGFEADLKGKIRATKADVVVTTAGDKPFVGWEDAEAKVKQQAGVRGVMAYLESEVIVKHVSNPAGMGIVLRGIQPAEATRVLDLGRTLKEGEVGFLAHPERIPKEPLGFGFDDVPPAPGEPRRDPAMPPAAGGPGILLGEELFAHTLRVYLGSQVDVACPMCGVGPTGPIPKLRTFRVAGHFYTGMYEFDSKLAYVSLAEAQRFLGLPGEITGLEIRLEHPDRAPDVAAGLAALLGPAYEVRSWEELNRGLFMALRLEKIAMFVVLTFIALVASFSIISNLIMMVTEKGREVAILKSMGATDGSILRIFVVEGLYIGLVGLGLGLTVGIGSCLLLSRVGLPLDPDVYYIQRLPVVMRAGEILGVGAAALGLCCLATLYPAFLASRLHPVDGLRYE